MRANAMAERSPRPDTAAASLLPGSEAVRINFIHEALRSTFHFEDLYHVLPATLLARATLGFSRALLFRWEKDEGVFRGLGFFSAGNRQEHERLQREIAEEQASLSSAIAGIPEGPEDAAEETLFLHRPEEMRRSDHWRSIGRRFEQPGDAIPELRNMTFRWDGSTIKLFSDEDTGSRTALFKDNSCLLIHADQLERMIVPPAIRKLFTGDSLWAGIRTQKGPRLLVIVDKVYEDSEIGAIDMLHMNWFTGQAALAIENAELIADLERTNKSLHELDTLKGNFLSTISHELRTPLTAITGFAHLLATDKVGPLNQGQHDILTRILNQADRLASVINDLIEIVEIDSGSALPMSPKSVDPLTILVEVLPKLEHRRASKSAHIEPITHGAIPQILADPKGLSRIFYHLIDNALKFSKDKGTVKIRFLPRDKELAIQIRDYGIGIPPEKMRTIFDAFYQIDGHLARVHQGMGVGLTLTRKLVQGAGGRLEVESEPDKGSKFTIIFPALPES
jgi:signal transduction histidine kinase